MSLRIEKAPTGVGRIGESVYLIYRGSQYLGLISKLRNTRTDIFPWQVKEYVDQSHPLKLIGNFYSDADSTKISNFDWDNCKIGGKTAAFLYAQKHFNV